MAVVFPLLSVTDAATLLTEGRVVAYPTEAVYGLGCDPQDEFAVLHILALKQRPVSAGLILITDDFARVRSYVDLVDVPAERLNAMQTSWPGPVTWLIPRSPLVPDWIAGSHTTVAVRVTAHPVAAQLCKTFGGPVVSTSANLRGQPAARSVAELEAIFAPGALAGVVEGSLGGREQPSEIWDLISGQQVRGKVRMGEN